MNLTVAPRLPFNRKAMRTLPAFFGKWKINILLVIWNNKAIPYIRYAAQGMKFAQSGETRMGISVTFQLFFSF